LRSAAARPFATFDGIDLHPGIPQKAAALFHSLICNHCFHNGNKRTAVIALDLFLAINDQLLSMSHQEIYELTKETAQANSEGRSPDSILDYLAAKVSRNSVGVDVLSAETLHEGLAPSMSADIKRLVAL
jgi:death-on-curing protein